MSIKPVDISEYASTPYALILPNGHLYKVEYYGNHCSTAYKLQDAGILEGCGGDYAGCVHVSDFEFDHIGRDYRDSKKVTQKQADTMFDYTLACGKIFNFEVLEITDKKSKTRAFRASQNVSTVSSVAAWR